MDHYIHYLQIWEIIRILNDNGIFDYGFATDTGNGAIVEFDNEEQKENYLNTFKN